MGGSMVHVFTAAAAAVLGMLLALTMADGRSVARKDGIAVGVFVDGVGNGWGNSRHPVASCDDLVDLGKTLLAFVFMATVVSYLAMFSSLLGLQSGRGLFGTVAAGLHGFNAVLLVVALAVAGSLFNEEHCGFKVKDVLDLGYALPLLVVGVVLSIVCAVVLVAGGAMRDAGAEENKAAAGEPIAEEKKEVEKVEETA